MHEEIKKRKALESKIEKMTEDLATARHLGQHVAALECSREDLEISRQKAERRAGEAEAKWQLSEAQVIELSRKYGGLETREREARETLSAAEKKLEERKEEVEALLKSNTDFERRLTSTQKRHDDEITSHRASIGAKNTLEQQCTKLESELATMRVRVVVGKGSYVEVDEVLRLRKSVDEANQKTAEKEEEVQKTNEELHRMHSSLSNLREKEREAESLKASLKAIEEKQEES